MGFNTHSFHIPSTSRLFAAYKESTIESQHYVKEIIKQKSN